MATNTTVKNGPATTTNKAAPEVLEVPTLSIFAFARNLGSTHRKTLSDSDELHKNYMKVSDAAKRAIKLEFLIGYVTGYLGVARDTAETIINGRVRFGAQATSEKPVRSKEQQNAFDAARKMFSFHIERNDKRVVRRETIKQVRLSSDFKEAANTFIGHFYEEVSAAAIDELIVMLQAYKKRLK